MVEREWAKVSFIHELMAAETPGLTSSTASNTPSAYSLVAYEYVVVPVDTVGGQMSSTLGLESLYAKMQGNFLSHPMQVQH